MYTTIIHRAMDAISNEQEIDAIQAVLSKEPWWPKQQEALRARSRAQAERMIRAAR